MMLFFEEDASAYHVLPVVLSKNSDRQRTMLAMRDADVQTTIHYGCAHQFSDDRAIFPMLRLPVWEEFADPELTFPLHPKLTQAEAGTVGGVLAAAVRSACGGRLSLGACHAA